MKLYQKKLVRQFKSYFVHFRKSNWKFHFSLAMNKTFVSVIKYIFILGIATGLLLLAFRGVDVKQTIYEIQNAKMFWVFVSVAASLVAFYSRALRWNLLIDPLGFNPSIKNTSAALMVGYIANLAIPRIGEITRCAMLNRSEKVPLEPLIGTVVVERIVDVICFITLSTLRCFH
jgi:uncharacterized protein (TIRG00374 family)